MVVTGKLAPIILNFISKVYQITEGKQGFLDLITLSLFKSTKNP